LAYTLYIPNLVSFDLKKTSDNSALRNRPALSPQKNTKQRPTISNNAAADCRILLNLVCGSGSGKKLKPTSENVPSVCRRIYLVSHMEKFDQHLWPSKVADAAEIGSLFDRR